VGLVASTSLVAAAPKPSLAEIVTTMNGVDEDAAGRSAAALGDRP
jgi:hypothetical protein